MDLKNNHDELTYLLAFFIANDKYHNDFYTFFCLFDEPFYLINFLEKNAKKIILSSTKTLYIFVKNNKI